MSSLDYLDLCRLCLVKDRVSVPIFEGEGDVRQIFLKIASCLPVKVTREDKLPKKICDDCVYKVELFYQFWNTTANAEKQLLQWIGEVEMDEKPDYVTEVLNSEQTENRLEMMQSAEEQSNNIEINMMDGMGLGLPIIMSTNEQMSSDPITSSANVQSVQSVGSTTQAHSQLVQKDGTHEEEENTEDECDVDDGMHVKDENDSSVNDSRSMDTSYVSVPLDCDEAGPSGLQQQKLSDMTDMEMAQQSAEGDTKVGRLPLLCIKVKPRLIKPSKDLSSRILLIRQKYLMESKNHQKRNILKITASKSPVIIKNSKPNNLSTLSKDTSVSLVNNKTHKKIPFLKTYYDEYFCDLCNYKNKRKAALAVHVARKHIHNAEKKEVEHICRLCDITFRCKPSLQTHWIRKHTEKFNFFCPKCGKKFKIKGELTTHLRRMHSDVSWKCEVCGNFYRSQHALYTHQKAYHFKPDFQCPYCPKCLVTQENLNQHIRLRHEKKDRAMCEECGKTFNEMWDLRKHQRVHTGEKPFPCSVCNRRFSRLAILNQHLLIHTGVRVYSCDVCNRSFTQKSGLISHRKKHSGNLPPLPVVYVQDIIKPFKESQTVL